MNPKQGTTLGPMGRHKISSSGLLGSRAYGGFGILSSVSGVSGCSVSYVPGPQKYVG